jgi:hypothetical protein
MENKLACNKCNQKGYLILSIINLDYCCENCGEWQDLALNSAYYPLGVTSGTQR